MDIRVKQIKPEEKELVAIYCHEVSDEVVEIVDFVKSRQGTVGATSDGHRYEIAVTDVFYIETIDNRTFLYCQKNTYECRQKLYELEEALSAKNFIRVSKSVLVNLMKIQSITPALNGRFLATLKNGEEIIISRKYVPDLKNRLKKH